MKYLLYRSFGNLDKDVKKHELVAVEYGKDIYDVTDALIKAAADDLAGLNTKSMRPPPSLRSGQRISVRPSGTPTR